MSDGAGFLGLGRGVNLSQSKTSFYSDDTSESFYFTRPKDVVCKSGTSGKAIALKANYFEVNQLPNFNFTQYRVDFEPALDIEKIRKSFIGRQRDLFGGYIYDGASSLFLTKELPEDTMRFECTSTENGVYMMTVKKTKNQLSMTSKRGDQLLNIIMRRAMSGLGLQLIRRNPYDAKSKIVLKDYKLELLPGYLSSIRKHEEKILLCCEITHKVLRTETAYDILKRCKEEESNPKDSFKRQIIGAVVITGYNNKTYRIDDVDFTKTASSTFKFNDREKSFIEYYQERYNIKINDPNQPLLLSNPKASDIRGGKSEILCLIPEICNITGLTDAMKNNFQLMRAMSEYTRMDPKQRIDRLLNFNKRILSTPMSAENFSQFGTKLEPKLVDITGRQLNQDTILFGNNKSFQNDNRVDWTNPMKINAMVENVSLTRWGLVYPERATNDTRTFLKLLEEVALGMGYTMKSPKMMELRDDRVGSYIKEIEEFIKKDPKFLVIILPNASADRYSAIKKITCVNNAIPTQVIVQKTMQPKKGNLGAVKSVATKVLIQINCKLGGVPWSINIPANGLMTIGFDVNHDSSNKSKSYGAFIASMDLKKCSKYYSGVAAHNRGEELSGTLSIHMKKALSTYMETHGYLPQRIIFYRDGVGEGDIKRVHEQEVQAVQQVIKESYRSVANEPLFGFIIVTKRINTRFFASKGSNFENPSAGCVVDTVVTLPERYDFYLISQSVRQGTVAPTSYNVIHDNLGLTPDKVQQLTYKMCHLYYNWSGTTRVPCVLQYAQKLGMLVGNFLHQPPNELLNNQLYFL